MVLSRIIDLIRNFSVPTLNYGNVEGEVVDIELNISTDENAVINTEEDLQLPPPDKFTHIIWERYVHYKESMYDYFVSFLNNFMEYRQLNEANMGSLNSPFTFLVDEFVLKFLFAMGFIGQSPVSWLIAGILFLVGKNRAKRILFWGYLNIIWFGISLAYFMYIINQPYDGLNPVPRITPNYKMD